MRPNVLSIAGFDPSAGAGVLADIKTFESHRVYGLGVCSAITMQNDAEFDEVKWVSIEKIKKQVDVLFMRYEIDYVKIGLIINLNILDEIIGHLLKKHPGIFIVWDPILESGSGYVFHKEIEQEKLFDVCRKIHLITPNIPEMKALIPDLNETDGAEYLAAHCSVLLKGGHRTDKVPVDILFRKNKQTNIYLGEIVSGGDKHGTGCVLSASILANLAKGETLINACREAKKYVAGFMASNDRRLGYHVKDYHLTIAN